MMHQRGFAYVEVMIAAVILALCAVPAANAIKNGLDAATISQAKALELRCVRNRMEAVLAEPYINLNLAAGTTAYNLDADASCAATTVVIDLKLFDGSKLTDLSSVASDEQKKTALLKIQVALAGSDYSFTTVVAR